MQASRRPPALAIVQHGHQYLITDGYDSREGLSEILEAFAAVFALHLHHEVPLHLHLSGTLIEAIAWHDPSFFRWIHALGEAGLLELLGSTYAQNVMTLFSDEHNRRQLDEALRLYRRHLGVPPETVKGCWVPERVWHTGKLSPVLRDTALLNGGYDYVLIDDRLALSLEGSYESSDRRRFDARTPPGRVHGVGDQGSVVDDLGCLRPYFIEGGAGLRAVSISAVLRYCVPLRQPGHRDDLRETMRRVAAAGPGAIAVYGDDLERSAAVGPWTRGRWTREGVAPYEAWLSWIKAEAQVTPVLLSSFLAEHPVTERRRVDPGTFFELARSMGAGEDYMRWWESASWRPYRELLTEAEALLLRAPDAREGLWGLAWKQLLACSYETAWHDVGLSEPSTFTSFTPPASTGFGAGRACSPAPWARAVSAHVRSVFVIAAAAAWQSRRDGRAHVERLDIDRDGAEEIILKNDWLYAVITPDHGGRLVYLFDLTCGGGRLVVGNPADDWNWQEEQNRFMEVPPNHPGAFADVGHENDAHGVLGTFAGDGHGNDAHSVRGTFADADDENDARGVLGTFAGDSGVEVCLVRRAGGPSLAGALKVFRLGARSRRIDVAYVLPRSAGRLDIDIALSPDYLSLLREGRILRAAERGTARGWRARTAGVWVHLPPGDPVTWDHPVRPECGHGKILRVRANGPCFGLSIGVGALPSRGSGGTRRRERLPIETIGQALMEYDLGPWESVRLLARAKNDHHEIVTSRGRYVLRQSRPSKTLEALRFEHELMDHLRWCGLPVPPVVPPRDGAPCAVVEGRLYRVTVFLPGAPCQKGHLGQLRAVARALAAYHRHTASFRPTARIPDEPQLPDVLRERLSGARVAPSARIPDEPQLPDVLRERLSGASVARRLGGLVCRALDHGAATLQLLDNVYSDLPRQILHGGCRRDSFLFQGDDLCGILDFDSARLDARILDLAIALHDFAKMDAGAAGPDERAAGLDLAVVAAFLGAYQEVQPLTSAELDALPHLLRARRLTRLLGACVSPAGLEALSPEQIAGIDLEDARLRWLDDHADALRAAMEGRGEREQRAIGVARSPDEDPAERRR